MRIFEFLRGKRDQKEAEKNVEKGVGEYINEEAGKSAERKAMVEAMGAEKATTEQMYNLRKEIGEEEEKSAERRAQVELMGPQKATQEQAETFAPVSENASTIIPEKQADIIPIASRKKKTADNKQVEKAA